ncbi:MAG: RluA family pseudouridine synthase [Candidatus Peribacteraceae bacterium]|jgi:RluA family pseudouridine synthase
MPIHPDRILWEDDAFLAVSKLPRELVVKGSGPVQRLPLLDFLKKDYPGLRPANRLDFETSGVVLFAKTKAALEAAIAQQKAGEWAKTYRTLVAGYVKADRGEIAKPLPARTGKGDAHALTRYRVLERFAGVTSLEAEIITGRHHQIRRHFSLIGNPLVLDHVYGEEKFNRAFAHEFRYHHFFLHAFSLAFPHPFTGDKVRVEAKLPMAFEEVLGKLRGIQHEK